jgi:hypothetical protein
MFKKAKVNWSKISPCYAKRSHGGIIATTSKRFSKKYKVSR